MDLSHTGTSQLSESKAWPSRAAHDRAASRSYKPQTMLKGNDDMKDMALRD